MIDRWYPTLGHVGPAGSWYAKRENWTHHTTNTWIIILFIITRCRCFFGWFAVERLLIGLRKRLSNLGSNFIHAASESRGEVVLNFYTVKAALELTTPVGQVIFNICFSETNLLHQGFSIQIAIFVSFVKVVEPSNGFRRFKILSNFLKGLHFVLALVSIFLSRSFTLIQQVLCLGYQNYCFLRGCLTENSRKHTQISSDVVAVRSSWLHNNIGVDLLLRDFVCYIN